MRTSIYDGLDISILRSKATEMQLALLALESGSKGESYSYTQGDGSKSVTYTRADAGRLRMALTEVLTQIDRLSGARVNRRPPMRAFF